LCLKAERGRETARGPIIVRDAFTGIAELSFGRTMSRAARKARLTTTRKAPESESGRFVEYLFTARIFAASGFAAIVRNAHYASNVRDINPAARVRLRDARQRF